MGIDRIVLPPQTAPGRPCLFLRFPVCRSVVKISVMPRQPGPDHQQIDIPAAVVNRRDDPAVPVDLPEPDHHLFAGYQCGEIAAASGPNGCRSSGASILSSRMRNGAPSRASRTVTVSPSATRTIFPRISAERTVRENTQSKSGSNFFTVHPPVAGSALPQKKAVHLRTPPPTHTTALPTMHEKCTVYPKANGTQFNCQ